LIINIQSNLFKIGRSPCPPRRLPREATTAPLPAAPSCLPSGRRRSPAGGGGGAQVSYVCSPHNPSPLRISTPHLLSTSPSTPVASGQIRALVGRISRLLPRIWRLPPRCDGRRRPGSPAAAERLRACSLNRRRRPQPLGGGPMLRARIRVPMGCCGAATARASGDEWLWRWSVTAASSRAAACTAWPASAAAKRPHVAGQAGLPNPRCW